MAFLTAYLEDIPVVKAQKYCSAEFFLGVSVARVFLLSGLVVVSVRTLVFENVACKSVISHLLRLVIQRWQVCFHR